MLDWQVILPVFFVSFVTAGLVCAALAVYRYVRFERGAEAQHVPFAIAAFVIQYGLVFGLSYVRDYLLLPTLVLFLTTVALIAVIWLGLQARSKGGTWIASAGLLTLAAYICRAVHDVFNT